MSRDASSGAVLPAQPAASDSLRADLLESLDRTQGSNDLYAFLRSRSAAEVEAVCRQYPIDRIRMNWGSVGVGGLTSDTAMRDIRRFELITMLAQILVTYSQLLKDSPELRLPASLPAKEFAALLMSRLTLFINAQQNVDITQTLRVRLYDFAKALMALAEYTPHALDCLLVSRPSLHADHDFWIVACRYNVAQITRKQADVLVAIESATAATSGKLPVPPQYAEGVERMLTKLKSML